jgi:hypothetical protein
MSAETVAVLRAAVADPVVVARYRSHVVVRGDDECWLWTGAISGKGHGRFQIGDSYLTDGEGRRRRVTYVVIAHRFGFAVNYGVDALLRVPLLGHRCDNPLCQNPRCWRKSNHTANRREYIARQSSVLGALADVRGARGRAREIRDAARAGEDIDAAVLAGAAPAHRAQLPMFAEPSRVHTDEPPTPAGGPGHGVSGGGQGGAPTANGVQGVLFNDQARGAGRPRGAPARRPPRSG